MEAIMSVDVEEWFHIPTGLDNILTFDQWDTAPQRIQEVLPRMLDIFEKNQVKSTFFFLGWIAEKYPLLVKETLKRGHEVATHGYAHKLIYNQTPAEFHSDIYKAKSIIESQTGKSVIGYRAPGFSITPQTSWAFDTLANNGIKYDSSIFPGRRFLGHYESFNMNPSIVETANGELYEFPQSVINFGLLRLSFFGGGYFRLFPKFFFLKMSAKLEKAGRPLIVYIHPRDIDADQPQVEFRAFKKFRHYVNISKTEQKLTDISGKFNFTSFERVITDPLFIEKLHASSTQQPAPSTKQHLL
jgi:polysaccharide deacetylase family protein (PEP-CTERM system associated)